MKQKIPFKKLVQYVCKRPGMYTPTGSFYEVFSFFLGYIEGNKDTPISGESWSVFNSYTCIKNGFPTKYICSYVFDSFGKNDEESIKLMEETILEFTKLKEIMSLKEILSYAKTNFQYEEGEVESIFRKFDKALLEGDKKIIKSLIEKHENANILWKGSYPSDITKELGQISNGQPIKKIYESEDKTQIKLITVDFPFPIEMNLKNGSWKINAKDIIELRMEKIKNSR
jgi:hypothetical protein